jgi:hypothetical protein
MVFEECCPCVGHILYKLKMINLVNLIDFNLVRWILFALQEARPVLDQVK